MLPTVSVPLIKPGVHDTLGITADASVTMLERSEPNRNIVLVIPPLGLHIYASPKAFPLHKLLTPMTSRDLVHPVLET